MKKLNYLLIIFLGCLNTVFAQQKGNVDNLPVHEYTLTIKEEMVNKTGKEVMGMTVNGTIPGPTLTFTEGEYAVIYVKNEMDKETSVHWHGILLPNFYDGVPYLTTPPIKPGTTFKYEFPLKQSGTYWYHSHTMLQEQSGVFGSIVINPKKKVLDYDKDLVLMLSDWTNEKPMNVLRNLKRGNEWYQMKKGTATPLNKVIARGALGAQLDFWRQRMEGADIADVYYPAFLINGEKSVDYSDYKPGEKIRLRIINGGASTQFWMTFGGKAPMLVSADGNDVVPVAHSKTFIGIAETYDFIITVPQNGKIELRAMAQDGSGITSAYFGAGKILPAEVLPKPDKINMMQKMAKMDMKMGAHALKFRPGKDERYKMKAEYGMQMDGMNMGDKKMDSDMKMDPKMKMDMSVDSKMDQSKMKMDDDKMKMDMSDDSKMDHSKMKMDGEKMKMDMSEDAKMDHSKMKMDDGKMKMDGSKMDSGMKMGDKKMNSNMQMGNVKMKMNMPKSTPAKSKVDHSKMQMGNDKMKMNMPKSSPSKSKVDDSKMQMGDGKMKMNMPKSTPAKSKADHSKMQMGNGKMKMNMPKSTPSKSKVDDSKMQMGNGKMPMNMPKSSPSKSKVDDSKMQMGNGKMQMNMPKSSPSKSKASQPKMKTGYGKMDMDMINDSNADHSEMILGDQNMKMDVNDMSMQMSGDTIKKPEMGGMQMAGMDMFSEYNYDFLKSPTKTNFDKNLPVKEVLLNLTGNMSRYIWSMNGVPLSEADKIKISSGEVTRITFNNLTMMHHPMHLHGHFFRVINKNGDYSPLKHTVNVPPMQEITIEFSGNNGDENGDWFLHCHVLYHLMGGMARVVSYDTPRDSKMKNYPITTAVNETDKFYTWSLLDVASNMAAYRFTSSNIRNQFNGSFEYGWNKNLEGEITYERYLHDYLRVFGGVNVENKMRNSVKDLKTTAVVGVRFLTPYLFSLDARVDSDLRPQISIGRSIMLFPRFAVFGYYEYQMDFGFVNKFPAGKNFGSETVWSAGAEYFLSRNFSLMGNYDNRYGAGGGLSIRF